MNDSPEPEPTPGHETERRLVSRKVRVRRSLGGGFALTAVLSVVLVTALTVLTRTGSIEDTLRTGVAAALDKERIDYATVGASGRDVTVEIPTGTDETETVEAGSGVDGVAGFEIDQVFASPAEAKACESFQRRLDKATAKRHIPFIGVSVQPTPEGVAMLAAAATIIESCPAGTILVGGHTDEDTPDGPTVSLERARAMVRILRQNGVPGDRLEPRGYGDQFPVSEGTTIAARQRNQRGSLVVGGL